MTARFLFRTLATLAAALAAALLFRHFHLPLPWMTGPLLVTAGASLLGAPTQSWAPLRNAGQWLIGTALGLYFTPEVGALVVRLWWAVGLAIAWALLLGWLFGLWLDRSLAGRLTEGGPARRATSYFAGAVGGASEMTLLAEQAGGRTDLVAAAHSLRMLIVTVAIPFGFSLLGLQGGDLTPPGTRQVTAAGLALLAAATFAGALLMSRVRGANPWFIGALGVAMGLTLSGVELSALPGWATNAAQLLIGVSLGVRFRAEFVHTAPRWLGAVAVGTVAMIGLSGLFALVLSRLAGLPAWTLVLATTPGGISEMAITAKVLGLGVPVVTAFQVCRLVAVLLLVEPLYRGWFRQG